ncbi:HNH endonuclease [Arenicella xantha]|uniref:HNH endonuclease n=1 Tax=Arenicella xantha TaxID=644221 RepID=A0A395JQS1_9GAMM|nr:HNH endonuclease [Arenicella xantha]RBP52905.1 HNH endonuclease [Arenicella xantha]
MNYWWVNQKQTFAQEVGNGDGYLWSPKLQSDGRRNFSYEFMKKVRQGDVIFSYANSAIMAIGVAQTHHYSFPKPDEFGNAGANWSDEGWKVDVRYTRLTSPVRTIDHINSLRNLLPKQYSPLQATNGHANQAYLFKIDQHLALALAELIDQHAVELVRQNKVNAETVIVPQVFERIEEWEDQIQSKIESNDSLSPTDRLTLIKARRGQGQFRQDVLRVEQRCRITGVARAEHLIASHIKPWRSANDAEKLDPQNGFILTPTVDHLFDKGYISFENSGEVVLSDILDKTALSKMGVIGHASRINAVQMSVPKRHYLEWHRENILL